MASSKLHGKVRIVSLAPNVTSILLALGAGRELVGVSNGVKMLRPWDSCRKWVTAGR